MFELEVKHSIEPESSLPPDTRELFFRQSSDQKPRFSVLQWEEHCTECAMPQCYTTCDLYEARSDGKCRRFVGGITPVTNSGNPGAPKIVKIKFKKWGSLLSTGYLNLLNAEDAKQIERKSERLSQLVSNLFINRFSIFGRRGVLSRLVRRFKRNMLEKKYLSLADSELDADSFVLEIFNPGDEDVEATFVIRAEKGDKNKIPYQKLMTLSPGFHSIRIDFAEIAPHVEAAVKHFVSITPNVAEVANEEVTLYFGFMGLVSAKPIKPTVKKAKSIKVVAWDLDNTIWKGVLVEDGPDSLKLMPGITETIKTLDSRGIVNSVISKNNHDEAFAQLKKFKLDHFIVFPQINWNPKSNAMKSLIHDFNVGEDTIAFIDDSPFERKEVQTAHPSVHVFDAVEYLDLLELPMFNPELSSESAGRREFYLSQGRRNQLLQDFEGEYFDFLKSCEIKLLIQKASTDNVDRIHELIQRTNQLNFSGNRYRKEDILELINRSDRDNYCMVCTDKFGNYGTVGFSVIDNQEAVMMDLMFSCRIQSKRIEHAFLASILKHFKGSGFDKFVALYNKTIKNEPAGKVFSDLNFEVANRQGDQIVYSYDLNKAINDDCVIDVTFEHKL